MTVVVKSLINSKQMESAQTTQYTATNCTAIIDNFTATNTSASNAQITVHIVPSGGTASASNTIYDTRTLTPKEVYTFPALIGKVIPSGGFISTTGTATALTINSGGREITT